MFLLWIWISIKFTEEWYMIGQHFSTGSENAHFRHRFFLFPANIFISGVWFYCESASASNLQKNDVWYDHIWLSFEIYSFSALYRYFRLKYSFPGYVSIVNLNQHQICWRMIYNMTLFFKRVGKCSFSA